MKTRIVLMIVVSLLLAISSIGAEEIAGLQLHVQEIDDGVIRLWVGDHISSTSVMAFATTKGIVVIDTFGVPEVDKGLREVIARTLGRSDFAFLINTHEHSDHTGGNSVYDDCTIVGHELIEAGMAEIVNNRDRLLTWLPNRIAELETELAALPVGDPKAAAIEEDLILKRLNLKVVEEGGIQPAPSLTFSDRMALDLGDTTFELFYIGGMHTASDTAIFVPVHGLLLTGDTMADVWLTDTPGCLASFRVRSGIHHDFPRMLANWDYLFAGKDRITTLLPAHWNGELSIEGAEARVDYIRTLWDGINQAAIQGKTMAEVNNEFRFETLFPELVGSPGLSAQNNYASVSEIWNEVTGQASAAETLYTLISDGTEADTILRVVAERDSDSPDYFFFEAEFNAYGYAFLQQNKIDEAITIFKITAELYPDSWNAYDSLGEALLRAGNTDAATEMYKKSLNLNPESPTGIEALKTIQAGVNAM